MLDSGCGCSRDRAYGYGTVETAMMMLYITAADRRINIRSATRRIIRRTAAAGDRVVSRCTFRYCKRDDFAQRNRRALLVFPASRIRGFPGTITRVKRFVSRSRVRFIFLNSFRPVRRFFWSVVHGNEYMVRKRSIACRLVLFFRVKTCGFRTPWFLIAAFEFKHVLLHFDDIPFNTFIIN